MGKLNFKLAAVILVSIVLMIALWMSCEKTPKSVMSPPTEPQQQLSLSKASPQIQAVMAVQNRHTPDLLAKANVVGTATGLSDGKLVIKVLTKKPGVTGIPESFDGIPVVVENRGEIRAQSYTEEYPIPVPIGVSCGNLMDPDRTGYLTAGTIGCTVEKMVKIGKGKNAQRVLKRFILSNNHVIAQENGGKVGDPIVQPGTYDMWNPPGHEVASLSELVSIKFTRKYPAPKYPENKMDAAIAESYGDEQSGWHVGTAVLPQAGGWSPSTTSAAAFVGQAVMKCGRTTEVTHGEVTLINVNIIVVYGTSGNYKYAYFVDQIETSTLIPYEHFSDSGDSGSLLVTDDENYNPVGLHFAGGVDENTNIGYSYSAPIQIVLDEFGVEIAE
jgi:hypothetical protein